MNVRNCRMCGKIFTYVTGQPVCPACKEMLEEKFQQVKAYIRDNKNCSVKEVSEKCEVEEGQIRQWVREERLEFGEGSVSGIICETCGTPIMTGRFCEKCKANMVNQLSAAGRRPEAPKPTQQVRDNSNKMRFLNH